MGVLVFALVIAVGSLPIALYQMFGALRWKREQAEPAPLRPYESQSATRRATNPLGTALARTTKFIG